MNCLSCRYNNAKYSLWFCILQEHTGRVFRLQFDEFQIVSSSHDDTILIWDFLNFTPNESNACRTPSRKSQEIQCNFDILMNNYI